LAEISEIYVGKGAPGKVQPATLLYFMFRINPGFLSLTDRRLKSATPQYFKWQS